MMIYLLVMIFISLYRDCKCCNAVMLLFADSIEMNWLSALHYDVLWDVNGCYKWE